MKKYMALLIVTTAVMTAGYTQQYYDIIKELTKINEAYQNNDYLAYNMKYLYAKANAPSVYRDSVGGACKIRNNSFYGKVGNIVHVQNASYRLSVFQDDQIMLLSEPVKQQAQFMPLADWDSAFVASSITKADISDKNDQRTITFSFTDSSIYEYYTIRYNLNTYLLQQMEYKLKQVPTGVEADEETAKEAFIITLRFSDYSNKPFDDDIFSEAAYMHNKNNEWIPAPAFAKYRIFDTRPPKKEEAEDD